MKCVDINQAVEADGLRIVIVKDMPSAWGVAAKAMIEYKALDCVYTHFIPRTDNKALRDWAGTHSAPVVAGNDQPPVNRWNDILLLLERIAPEKPLVPEDPKERIQMFGIGHELCGELGLGWNRRLDMTRPPEGTELSALAKKYGFREPDVSLANGRVVALMQELASILKAQQVQGSDFFVGQSITATDFYWAAFSNFVAIQPPELCPMNPIARPYFENPEVKAAIDPILIEHRDRIMQNHFKLPLEL
ncbi:MAG TPA: hypothetical protein DCM54_10080 [Gammaproteobacteria bacterium]|nr:hypothetical protein [Gammaproteobacteria bacterium]